MPSFDVVSKVDMAEVDNAINGVKRETQQRFDLKGTKAGAERAEGVLTVTADSEMQLRQMHELLHTYFARRDVDSRALEFKTPEKATGSSLRQQVTIRQGLDADLGRKIVKAVKGTKLRVQGLDSGRRTARIRQEARRPTGSHRLHQRDGHRAAPPVRQLPRVAGRGLLLCLTAVDPGDTPAMRSITTLGDILWSMIASRNSDENGP